MERILRKASVFMLQRAKALIYVTEVGSLRHVDLYKRRPPENDSHCDLIKQNLACFVEYFLKMYEIAVA